MEIVKYVEISIGLKEGTAAGAVRWFAVKIRELDEELAEIENKLEGKCVEILHAENVLEIHGIGGKTISGILAKMGEITRFDDVKEIQKLSGLGLVACSSGKHKGETRISHRGRKRLRYWLFQAEWSVVAHGEEYKWVHAYYTTRAGNPLQKIQSLIVIACKLLGVNYTILKAGKKYDPEKLLKDIRYPANVQSTAVYSARKESFQDPAEFQKHLELSRVLERAPKETGQTIPISRRPTKGKHSGASTESVLCGTDPVCKYSKANKSCSWQEYSP